MADLNPEAFQQRVLERLTDMSEELHATREETFAIGRRLDSMDARLKAIENVTDEIRTDLTNITRTHGAVLSMLGAFDDRQLRADGQINDLLRRVERIERHKGDAT